MTVMRMQTGEPRNQGRREQTAQRNMESEYLPCRIGFKRTAFEREKVRAAESQPYIKHQKRRKYDQCHNGARSILAVMFGM